MAEPILTDTLQGINSSPPGKELPPIPQGLRVPDTQNLSPQKGIQQLQLAQQSPNMLMDFQRVLANASKEAYRDRQQSELSNLGFNPSEVSGGTFASIISDFESRRGADVGKTYAATLSAYAVAQEQITNRLQFMQQLEESRRQFEAEMKLRKKELKLQTSLSKKEMKLKKKMLEQEQSNWEREFALAQYKAHKSTQATGFFQDTGFDMGSLRAVYQQLSPPPAMSMQQSASQLLGAVNSAGFSLGFNPDSYLNQ